MANLAIKGHQKRGSEVIALLEMLGGLNKFKLEGNPCGVTMEQNYVIENGIITLLGFDKNRTVFHGWRIFTLEQFLTQFPYKVGDKVYYDNKVCDVIEMRWNSNLNTISYSVCDGKMKNLTIKEDLKPYNKATKEFYNKYCINCGSQRCTAEGEWLEGCVHYKEETMSKNICDSCLNNEGCWVECSRKKQEREKETKKDLDWHLTDYLEFENNDDAWANEVEVNLGNDYEIQIRDGKTFIVRKNPQYPKTYKECCVKISAIADRHYFYTKRDKEDYPEEIKILDTLDNLRKLLICRNAYWKIAGEQMGLGKSWEPDTCQIVYSIGRYSNTTVLHNDMYGGFFILEFPTEEMRDAFYENFEKLIEECKKLL